MSTMRLPHERIEGGGGPSLESEAAPSDTTAKGVLRVLLVEDSEDDALLVMRKLREGGYSLEARRVETGVALESALREGAWDLVISDYRLPQYDGLRALQLVRSCAGDVPFILVSGVIGEDLAVAAMKAGAHDYLLKDALARLVPAVKRELAEAEVRRQQRAAEAEREHHLLVLRRLIEASVDLMSARSLGEVLQKAADSSLRLTGARLSVTGHGFVGNTFRVSGTARLPDAPPCPPTATFCQIKGGVYLALREVDSVRLTDAALRARREWQGPPAGHVPLRGLLGVRLIGSEEQTKGLIMVTDKADGTDFTAADESILRQFAALTSLALQHLEAVDQAQQNAAETRQLTESLPQLVWSCKADGACDYLSRQWIEYTGIPEHLQMSYGWLEQLHPDDYPQAITHWTEAVNRGTPFDLEVRIRRADGAYRWFKSRSVPIRDHAGKITRWYGTNTDIEGLKTVEAELQQAHDELEVKVKERTVELVSANAALRHANRALQTLSQCNQALVEAASEGELLDRVCRVVVQTGGYRGVWVGYVEQGDHLRVRPAAQAGFEPGYLDTLITLWSAPEHLEGPVAQALRTRQPAIFRQALPGPASAPGGCPATLVLPVQVRDLPLAVLTINAEQVDAFDEAETRLFSELAGDLGYGILALRTRLERDRAAQALGRWAQLFELAGWGVAIGSAEGAVFEMMNPAYARMHGFGVPELTGRSMLDVFAPEYREEARVYMERALAKGRAIFESRHQRRDGSTFPALVDMSAMRDEIGRVLYRVVYTQDISELKSLEARLLEVGEAERRRIGHDLHDSLCQQLAGIAYLATAVHEKLAQAVPEEKESLERISQLLQGAIDQAHGVARGLHPVEMEPGGLMRALEELCANYRQMYSIGIRFACPTPVPVEDNATATHLYRIAQEAVSNAIKHGKASQLTLRLSVKEHAIALGITDNGIGLPEPMPQATGLGLETMRFRARSIGATLEIARRREGGTAVVCVLPIRQ
jgi:PAS domain S-box-containing protein